MRAIGSDDMVVIRATHQVQKLLRVAVDEAAASDGVLGDWYVKRFMIDRRPLLMMMSAVSLFPIITPARDVRSLPERLGSIVSDRLKRIGVDEMVIQREVATMTSVAVGRTKDRSVMGSLVEFCLAGVRREPMSGEWECSATTTGWDIRSQSRSSTRARISRPGRCAPFRFLR